MIRTPSGKNLMNEQEAIQWLLDNNALPFQCTADYVGGAEIGLGTIVNPTPAKVRVGSLIFFADSKVSTVIAITSNSFICSEEYNDLVDDIVYVSNVQLNASGHLIVTLSNGTDIDAGLIKQVSGFSINDSQHLIVSYNDGTTTDLGAIFSGNVNIAGNFTANSIIENMAGYNFTEITVSNAEINPIYAGVVKNGNKLTLVYAFEFKKTDTMAGYNQLAQFGIPSAVGAKLFPITSSLLDRKRAYCVGLDGATDTDVQVYLSKFSNTVLTLNSTDLNSLTTGNKYYIRYEVTFLLSENLAA